jgi:hypothetical protein
MLTAISQTLLKSLKNAPRRQEKGQAADGGIGIAPYLSVSFCIFPSLSVPLRTSWCNEANVVIAKNIFANEPGSSRFAASSGGRVSDQPYLPRAMRLAGRGPAVALRNLR